MKRHVYLAGPILGRTGPEANRWREYVAEALAEHDIIGISPLRCEPIIGERYDGNYPDDRFGTSRAISAKNRFDVMACDLVFAYMPDTCPMSIGTLGEIFWADAYGKQVILVSDSPSLWDHPVLDAAVDWKLSTIHEGIDVCVGILAGYVGGKNV